jgi:hypothetical protein
MIKISSTNLFPTIQPYLPKDPTIIEAGSFNGKDTLRMAAF